MSVKSSTKKKWIFLLAHCFLHGSSGLIGKKKRKTKFFMAVQRLLLGNS